MNETAGGFTDARGERLSEGRRVPHWREGVLTLVGVLLATLAACGGGASSSPTASPSKSVVASPSPQATATVCILDPSTAGTARASIDRSSRAVTVQVVGQPPTTVLPATSPGQTYAYSDPTLAPDARSLVVGANVKGTNGEWQAGLWRFDLTTGSSSLVLASDLNTFDFEDPAFSPDGARIAYTRVSYTPRPSSGFYRSFEVWVVNSDGTHAAKAVAGRMPRWSSDGRYLAFDPQTMAGASLGRAFVDANTFRPGELELPDCNA